MRRLFDFLRHIKFFFFLDKLLPATYIQIQLINLILTIYQNNHAR